MARDRVNNLKWESPAGGGTETDRYPTYLNPAEDYPQVRGVIMQRHVGPAETDHTDDEAVGLERDATERLMFWDAENPTPIPLTTLLTGGGLSQTTHQVLRQLIHFIDNGPAEGFATGAYREMTGTVFPTAVIWWENSSKLKKIVEKLITWTGINPTTIEWNVYDIDGTTVLGSVTDTISYSTVFETSRVRAISGGIIPGGGLPPATQQGQVFISVDGLTFTIEQPLTSYPDGWLVNNNGYLLVVG